MISPSTLDLATALVRDLIGRGLTVATAESCTGGLIAAALTSVSGSSAVVDRGFVTYSNEAKVEMLGVPADLIALHGAVSQPVALAMAHGVLDHAMADLAVSVTGIAGPGGGSEHKPVGLVHFAAQARGQPPIAVERRFGDVGRDRVRELAVIEALGMLRSVARI